jgi:arylsulfatase
MLPPLPDETTFEFRGDVQNVMPGMIPRIYNRSYAITADLVVPAGGAEGVIVAEADHLGGFTLYVKDGKLTHTYSMMGVFVFQQVAEEDLPTGNVTVRMEFEADGAKPATGGEVTLFIDGRPVGKGRMDHTVPVRFSGYSGMDIGRDNGGVVDRSYESQKPFAFTGTVNKVVFDIKPHLSDEDELTVHAATRRTVMGFDDETTDVLIGGYLSTDAAHEDYEAVLGCGARLWGAVVVSRDLEGNVAVEETDHMVEEGAAGLAAVGFAVGLFAPPLLAATAIGAAVGAVGGKALHKKTGSKIEEMAGETIPIGGAGLIVAYKHADAQTVEPAIARAVKKVVGEAEGHHVKALRGALAEAQQKMAEADS